MRPAGSAQHRGREIERDAELRHVGGAGAGETVDQVGRQIWRGMLDREVPLLSAEQRVGRDREHEGCADQRVDHLCQVLGIVFPSPIANDAVGIDEEVLRIGGDRIGDAVGGLAGLLMSTAATPWAAKVR